MSGETKHPKRNGFRMKPQFSLQTMLILILVAALVCAWLLAPRLEEKTLGGGALKIRGQWTRPAGVPNSTSPSPAAESRLYGRWILYDGFGRKLVDGRFRDGEAAGDWSYFDVDGHPILRGPAQRGLVDGPWTARHANGDPAQDVTFAQRVSYNDVTHFYPMGPDRISERTGTAHRYWEDGAPSMVGSFAGDQRDGRWTWYDRQGRKVVEGAYRRGRKQGEWHRWDPPGSEPVVEYYARGKRIDDPDALLTRLAGDLRTGDPWKRARAACGLEAMGVAAVPLLREILGDGDPMEQLLAIRTLRHIGPDAREATEDLLAASEHENPRIRLHSLLALAEVAPGRAGGIFSQLLALAADRENEHQGLELACLTRAGPVGMRQLAAAIDDPRKSVRRTAVDTLVRMYNERTWGPVAGGDPNVDVGELAATLHQAQEHPDPEIREWAGERPAPSNPGMGGMF